MQKDYEKYEGRVSGDGNPFWNQSYYYNAYDPATRTGVLVRIGVMEKREEANSWLIVFRDGLPIFARTNMNLPYTSERPLGGIDIAGMRVHAEVPLKKTRLTFDSPDFSADLTWNELHPMEDCVAMSNDAEGALTRELAHVHLEGTATVTGTLTHRGIKSELNGKGFRDIAAGPRNWDALLHYRLAWPIFDNGMAFAGVHGLSTGGDSTYLRMMHDGEQWRRIKHIDDQMVFGADKTSVDSARWVFVDELDRRFEITGKPLFSWLFPLDTFVLREQLMEFRLGDGTKGYGLYETGYRLPWKGVE